MKTAYIWGLLAAAFGLVSYIFNVLYVDVFGVNMLAQMGVIGLVVQRLVSLISIIGLIIFFSIGIAQCNHANKLKSPIRVDLSRLPRSGFWSRAKWVYAIDVFIGFPLALAIFIWHKSMVVYSVMDTTPFWCLAATAIGILIIVCLKIVLLPLIVRRFHDCDLPTWLAVGLLMASCCPHVWWLASVMVIIIAGFVDGTIGRNRYGDDPKTRDAP